jgi:Uma2 family endonuclease
VNEPIQARERLERYHFNVDQYYRMAEAGILNEDARVELIEGDIIRMAPIGPPHASTVDQLARILTLQAGSLVVRTQGPVRLSSTSEPEPDIALLKQKPGSYRDAHPGPEDILLLIEVADTTAGNDRNVKLPLYARYGVPEVWLIDLQAGRLEMYREPSGSTYVRCVRSAPDEVVSPEAAPQIRINLADILRP